MRETTDGADSAAGLPDPQGTGLGPALRFGFWVAVLLACLTVATFALAITALPDVVPYPFTSDVIAEQWPGDYLWMYPAMVLMLVFLAFVAAVHAYSGAPSKIFSLLGLCFSAIATTVLLADYFVQLTVAPLSLEKGQLDGWALLSMFNPNGVFIALEELGYLLMALALACLAPVFSGENGVERTLRWLLALCFAAAMAALVVVSALYGFDRGTVFEVLVITIVWLTLVLAGPLVAVVFQRASGRARRA